MKVLVVMCGILLASCSLTPTQNAELSWNEALKPYFDQYGEPDVIANDEYDLSFSKWRECYWYFDTYSLLVTFHFYDPVSFDERGEWDVVEEEIFYTFEQITLPFIKEHGQPDEIHKGYGYEYWYWYFDKNSIVAKFSSDYRDFWESSWTTFYTFEQISQPYIDKYGEPEEVNEYFSIDYWSIDWWWWSKGIEVTFLDTEYDDTFGWIVDSIYTFTPIY